MKIEGLNSTISVNDLNAFVKKYRLPEWIKIQ